MPSKFSIIIPIYNVEKYLCKCLDSIVNISYKNKEVILVNNGSTDSSAKIAKEYVDKYNYMKLINKKNGGLSSARNRGLDEAIGKYVIFVDSDDTVNDNISIIMRELEDKIIDVTISNYIKDIKGKYKISSKNKKLDKHIKLRNIGIYNYNVDDTLRDIIICYTDGLYNVCNKIFLKKFIEDNNLRFEHILHEDVEWTLKCVLKMTSFFYTNYSWYMHRIIRDGSIMNSRKDESINTVLYLCEKIIRFNDTYINNINLRKSIKKILSNSMFSTLQYYYSANNKKRILENYKKNIKILSYSNNIKSKIMYYFIKIFGWKIFFKVLKIYLRLKSYSIFS